MRKMLCGGQVARRAPGLWLVNCRGCGCRCCPCPADVSGADTVTAKSVSQVSLCGWRGLYLRSHPDRPWQSPTCPHILSCSSGDASARSINTRSLER